MYYYNPYMMMYPMASNATATKGLFRGLLGRGINWSSIISGTGKTLNIINQAIPVVKEISPVMKNARTMFRVMNEFKKADTPSNQIATDSQPITSTNNRSTIPINTETKEQNMIHNNPNGPTFFM